MPEQSTETKETDLAKVLAIIDEETKYCRDNGAGREVQLLGYLKTRIEKEVISGQPTEPRPAA